jgi:hypothetical protein
VIVKHDDLSDRSWVLKLKDRFLFHTQDHNVFPAHTHLTNVRQIEVNIKCNTYSTSTFSHRFLGIFDLRGMRRAIKVSRESAYLK